MNRLYSPMAPGPTVPRVRILGGEADAATIDEVMAFTEDRVLQGLPTTIANHNLHSLRLTRREMFWRRASVRQRRISAWAGWAAASPLRRGGRRGRPRP